MTIPISPLAGPATKPGYPPKAGGRRECRKPRGGRPAYWSFGVTRERHDHFWFFCIMAWVIALTFPATAQALEPTAGYPSVQRAFLREEFETVAMLARTFIAENPTAPEAYRVWLWLALSLDHLQRANEALKELDHLKRQLRVADPFWPEVLYWEGDISRRAVQMVRAKLAFQRLLERYPNSTWAAQSRMGLGLIDLHQQAFESAIGHFHEVALRRPGTTLASDALLFEGLCQLRLGKFQDAIAVFQPLLRQLQQPAAVAQAAFYYGESLSGLSRFDEAITAYRRATDASASSLWGRLSQFGLGWAQYRLGRCEESVKAFDQYLSQRNPDHRIEALFAGGSCLLRLNRRNEAAERFQQIIAANPGHPLAVDSGLILVDSYRREGQLVAAAELIYRLLRESMSEKARGQLRLRLGSIALEEGNVTKAKTLFELARESRELPVQQAALSGLGDVQLFLGELDGAKRFYGQAAQISTGGGLTAYAEYQLGRIALQTGEFEQAIEVFERLADRSDSGFADEAHLALVIAYLNRHDAASVRTQLAAMRQRQPAPSLMARASYYEALLAFEEGDEDNALQLCRDVVKGAPGSDEAFNARLLLLDVESRESNPQGMMSALQRIFTSERLPRNQQAKIAQQLGDLAREQGSYAQAIRWYYTAEWLLPASAGEAAYRIASCYEEAGESGLALSWYQEIRQPAWRIRGQLAAAKLLEREERLAEAEAIYRRLSREPIPEAKVASERLAAIQKARRRPNRE